MKSRFFICVIFVGALIVSGCSIGLRRDSEKIEASLLEITPLGSSPEVVLEFIKKKEWQTKGYSQQSGFYKQQPGRKAETIGTSHIQASLGDYYHFPIGTTNTSAFWGFDSDRRLIGIWIWKTTDSL
jgi:hypothetical protein